MNCVSAGENGVNRVVILLFSATWAEQEGEEIRRPGRSFLRPELSKAAEHPNLAQNNSEENSLLGNVQASSSNHNRNQDNADASSITSFGNTDVNGGKGYGAMGQDEQRQREEDEREREERERERLNAIAGQAGK